MKHGEQTVARNVWRRPITAPTFEATGAKHLFAQGAVEFDVAPGTYTYRVEVSDLESTRQAVGTKDVSVRPFRGLALGRPAMLQATGTGDELTPINLRGNVNFGRPSRAAVAFTLPDSTTPYTLSYTLTRGTPEKPEGSPVRRDSLRSGDARVRSFGTLELTHAGPDRVGLTPQPTATGQIARLALLDLDTAPLRDGAYTLDLALSAGGRRDTVQTRFQLFWADLPLALYDLDLSIRQLDFIASSQVISEINSGDRATRERKFRTFWATQDPTPGTEYNELMAEYYRRIDHAFFTFGVGSLVGWRTDRGRIYILYGEPARVERILPPNAPAREEWYYTDPRQPDSGRKFTFLDRKGNGLFELLNPGK